MGNIHTSGEDYLEAILVLWNKQNGEVRSIDVARELNVTKPSGFRCCAIKKLLPILGEPTNR